MPGYNHRKKGRGDELRSTNIFFVLFFFFCDSKNKKRYKKEPRILFCISLSLTFMFYPDWTDTSNVLITLLIIIGSAGLVLQEYYPDSRMGYSKFNKNSGINVSLFYFIRYGLVLISLIV